MCAKTICGAVYAHDRRKLGDGRKKILIIYGDCKAVNRSTFDDVNHPSGDLNALRLGQIGKRAVPMGAFGHSKIGKPFPAQDLAPFMSELNRLTLPKNVPCQTQNWRAAM